MKRAGLFLFSFLEEVRYLHAAATSLEVEDWRSSSAGNVRTRSLTVPASTTVFRQRLYFAVT